MKRLTILFLSLLMLVGGAQAEIIGVDPATGQKFYSHAALTSSFLIEVAKGNVRDHAMEHKFGANQDVDVGTEDVWEHGGIVNWPSSAITMNMVSTSVNDTSAGTGCRTMVIAGLDSTLLESTETITMTGQTIVTTANQYRRVNRMYCATFGSLFQNDGEMHLFTGTATAGAPDDDTLVYSTIEPGHGQTLQAFYTIPANKTAYLLDGTFSTDAAAKAAEGSFYIRTDALDADSGWRIQAHFKTGDFYPKGYVGPPGLPGGTDLRVSATATANNTFIAATFDLLLVNN